MLFPELEARVADVRSRIRAAAARGGRGQNVTIIAVTKTHGPGAVVAAHDAGLTDVGENRVQEAVAKMKEVTVPVRWHLIGHLQRNKVKSLAKFDLLHSLDSSRLADTVSEFGLGANAPVKALMQINVVGEESKGGYAPNDWQGEAERLRSLAGVRVLGVMTMAPLDADETTLRATFSGARRAREILCAAGHNAPELSMGMSSDYEVAVEEGATYIRLGTILFGARPA
jgi:pyridoxal phosphate enzyme (YggS family)